MIRRVVSLCYRLPILLAAVLASPAWADSLEETLRSTDLVVLGRLVDVAVEDASWITMDGGRESGRQGTARLEVDTIWWGRLDEGNTLEIRWTYIEGDGDDGRKPRQEGHAGIFFLVCAGQESDRCRPTAEAPLAVTELLHLATEQEDEIVELLGRYPARLLGPTVIDAGAAPEITLELSNRGDEPLELPGLVTTEGALSYGKGFRLRVRAGSATGPEVSRSLMKLRQSSDLAPLVLAPGERREVPLDLATLFRLDRSGYYVIEVELDGYPPQFPLVLQLNR